MGDLDVSGEEEKKEDKKKKKVGFTSGDENEILIKLNARGRRKHITVITGFEKFGLKLKKCAKDLSKKFACSASVTKGKCSLICVVCGCRLLSLFCFPFPCRFVSTSYKCAAHRLLGLLLLPSCPPSPYSLTDTFPICNFDSPILS